MLKYSVGCLQSSLPSQRSQGDLHLQLNYKPYEDDEESHDAYKERESFAVARQEAAITDVKSAAGMKRSVRVQVHSQHVTQETFRVGFGVVIILMMESTCSCIQVLGHLV